MWCGRRPRAARPLPPPRPLELNPNGGGKRAYKHPSDDKAQTRGMPRALPAVPPRVKEGLTAAPPGVRSGGRKNVRRTRQQAQRPRAATDTVRERAPHRLSVYARWRAAEEGARSACGARSARRNDHDKANRHHHTPPRAPCSSVAARAASLRYTCDARIALASPVAMRIGETRSARSGEEIETQQ